MTDITDKTTNTLNKNSKENLFNYLLIVKESKIIIVKINGHN